MYSVPVLCIVYLFYRTTFGGILYNLAHGDSMLTFHACGRIVMMKKQSFLWNSCL